jgi:hypothetical protein
MAFRHGEAAVLMRFVVLESETNVSTRPVFHSGFNVMEGLRESTVHGRFEQSVSASGMRIEFGNIS